MAQTNQPNRRTPQESRPSREDASASRRSGRGRQQRPTGGDGAGVSQASPGRQRRRQQAAQREGGLPDETVQLGRSGRRGKVRRQRRSARSRARQRQQQTRRDSRRRVAGIPLPIMVLSAVSLVLCLVTGGLSIAKRFAKGASDAEASAAVEETATEEGKVSFAAVGDNLINAAGDYNIDLLTMADGWSGTLGDNMYDFSPLYAQLSKAIGSYDISFISQETTLGGLNSGHEYKGFPSFNTPDEMATAIANAGFTVVNCNSNHTWDLGADAIEHSQEVWAEQDGVTTVGSYASEEDRADIRVVEKNGIKIAFLSYSYGQNGYVAGTVPNDYYAPTFDKDVMGEEVAKAQDLADAVVVYMNWGDDITHEPNDEEHDYASFLAGLGVDLVIGSHPHVIQPVAYVARGIRTTDGSGTSAANGMLCVYGLGSPINGYTLPRTSVAGMFSCDFVRDKDGEVSIQNPVWHPLVEHNDGETETVYLLEDYTDELAATNLLLSRVGEDETYTTTDPIEFVRETTTTVLGDAIEVEV